MAEWIRTVAASEVQEEEPVGLRLAGRDIALFRYGGKIFATANVCTHGQARLSDGYQEGHLIECPLHQGQFDVRTGACIALPVTVDIETYEIRVSDGDIEVLIP
jgi:naphthalene 1,2-dioxygenase ferredoxin component